MLGRLKQIEMLDPMSVKLLGLELVQLLFLTCLLHYLESTRQSLQTLFPLVGCYESGGRWLVLE